MLFVTDAPDLFSSLQTGYNSQPPLQPPVVGSALSYGNDFDCFVLSLSPSTGELQSASYLGHGSSEEECNAILSVSLPAGSSPVPTSPPVDAILVLGMTLSPDFMWAPPDGTSFYQSPFKGPAQTSDVFVAALTADLRSYLGSTRIGGSRNDDAISLAVHPTRGLVAVGGWSNSFDFPTKGTRYPLKTSPGSLLPDAFITILDPSLHSILLSGLLGGPGEDTIASLTWLPDSTTTGSSNYLLSLAFGGSGAPGFPIPSTLPSFAKNVTAFSSPFAAASGNGNQESYSLVGLLRLSFSNGSLSIPDSSSLKTALFSDNGRVLSVRQVSGGTLAVSGTSGPPLFPPKALSPPFQASFGGDLDSFIALFDPALSQLLYFTSLGGTGTDFTFPTGTY